MAKESAIMVQQECIELVDRSIPRSAHIAGQIFLFREKSSHSWASPWKIYLCGWHNESRTQQINTAPSCCWLSPTQKKETQPWPTMSPLWLRFFSSYQFDSFFLSVEFFDSDDYAGCIRGSVCVYTHTGHTSSEFAWPIPFFFFFFGGDPFKLAQKRLFDSRQRKGSTLSVKMYRTLHTQREHRDGERERSAVCAHLPQFGCSQLTQCASLENDELADTFL